MGKTRSCRRSPGENAVHERAVKIRKMTDVQINEFFYKQWDEGYKSGYEAGKTDALTAEQQPATEQTTDQTVDRDYEILSFIEDVAAFPGIGSATIGKMRQVARKRGINVD